MRIAVLPLDERPVNATLPAMVAAIAGAEAELPPTAALPQMRTPADPDALTTWTRETASEVDALVVSMDLLGYGGLVGSRTSVDGVEAVTARLAVLEEVRADRPDLPISGVTTVLRASDSYSAAEEPAYWSDYGRELHALGAELHRDFVDEDNAATVRCADVPAPVRGDFWRRRLRNHAVDLYCLGLAANGVVEPMLVTADDTAARSAGSVEQVWLRHWIRTLGLEHEVLSYPGADEVGAVLVARALCRSSGVRPRIAVVVVEEGGEQRIAPFENVPVATTVARQIRAAGAELVTATGVGDPGSIGRANSLPRSARSARSGGSVVDGADAVLVVHTPDDDRRDLTKHAPEAAPEAAERVCQVLGSLQGGVVGLADVRYANGSDPELVERLAGQDMLADLAAYGGWNTAGNTIGSVVAALVAGVVGRHRGCLVGDAERRLLVHRLLEDYGYQARARPELTAQPCFSGHQALPFTEAVTAERYLDQLRPRLERARIDLGSAVAGWRLPRVSLPWNRTFEVDFEVRRS